MNRLMASLALVVVCVVGCRTADQLASPDARPVARDARRQIKVANVAELIDAIGSDRVIELAGGAYDLSKVSNEYREHVKLEKVFDGLQVIVRDVRNLKIVGAGDAPVSVTTPYAYANVLTFRKAAGVELVNLRLGHAPDPGYCVGGVVALAETDGVVIDRCDLYGCGTEGISAEDARKLLVKDSTIRDCSYGIMTLQGCRDVRFERTRMVNNECFTPIAVDDCRDVAFVDCVITGNRTALDADKAGPLFSATSSSRVSVRGGEIADNQANGLAPAGSDITFAGVKTPGGKTQPE